MLDLHFNAKGSIHHPQLAAPALLPFTNTFAGGIDFMGGINSFTNT
jgi:hypothetical protein